VVRDNSWHLSDVASRERVTSHEELRAIQASA